MHKTMGILLIPLQITQYLREIFLILILRQNSSFVKFRRVSGYSEYLHQIVSCSRYFLNPQRVKTRCDASFCFSVSAVMQETSGWQRAQFDMAAIASLI